MANIDDISFQLVAAAGTARSLAFEALGEAKGGGFERAEALLEQSKKANLEAHAIQTDLLKQEAQGNHTTVNVLLMHAQDHLMCAMLAQELIAEIIELYRVR